MDRNPTAILKELVSFRTLTEDPIEIAKSFTYIDDIMRQVPNWGYREYVSNGRVSRVYSHVKYIEADEKNFDIYFYGKIDVVNAPDSHFIATQKGQRLYGRGTSDMKFGIAVGIATLLKLSAALLEKKIAFIITSDEEIGGIDGAAYLVDIQKFRGKCIIGPNGKLDEHTWNLELENKGAIHTTFTAEGKSAHGSRPWEGDNALDKLIALYIQLKHEFNRGTEQHWDSTLNLGFLSGGFATNAVADRGIMKLDFRYCNQEQRDSYYEMVHEVCTHLGVRYDHYVDATYINVNLTDKYIEQYLSVALYHVHEEEMNIMRSHGSHDIREFFRVGITPILFMPRGGGNHTNNEWVQLSDLEVLTKINSEFIHKFYVEG